MFLLPTIVAGKIEEKEVKMNTYFQVKDYYKLLALHKAIMQAKFSTNLTDPVLSGSPLLAEMINDLTQIIVQTELERGDEQAAKNWIDTYTFKESMKSIWQIVLERARVPLWKTWNKVQKREFTSILFSPYQIDDVIFDKFAEEVDSTFMS